MDEDWGIIISGSHSSVITHDLAAQWMRRCHACWAGLKIMA